MVAGKLEPKEGDSTFRPSRSYDSRRTSRSAGESIVEICCAREIRATGSSDLVAGRGRSRGADATTLPRSVSLHWHQESMETANSESVTPHHWDFSGRNSNTGSNKLERPPNLAEGSPVRLVRKGFRSSQRGSAHRRSIPLAALVPTHDQQISGDTHGTGID